MIIYEDLVGTAERLAGRRLSTTPLPPPLLGSLMDFYGSDIQLTPPQEWALGNGLVDGPCSMLICSSTNSGKTLVGILKLFQEATVHGHRSVYIVPLKALAEEKVLEFSTIAEGISRHGGPQVKISITTGDYQITNDFLGSPPPEDGQVVICTPERLEVMLRNPENHAWARQVGAYIIDEFHLLGEGKRGATVESLVTRIFALGGTPSIIGLSATFGNLPDIEQWFSANDQQVKTYRSDHRYPKLHRSVAVTEDSNTLVLQRARDVISDPDRGMLVFVYTKRDAEKLAALLASETGAPDQICYFHAGLPRDQRKVLAQAIRDRRIRIVATTTSLKLGMNFPVTDVIIRDPIWEGKKRLQTADVLQMMGRAGRGNVTGEATIICNNTELGEHYTKELTLGNVGSIIPQLIPLPPTHYTRKSKTPEIPSINPLGSMVLTEFVVRGKASPKEIVAYVSRSYSASMGLIPSQKIKETITALESGKMIYHQEGSEDTFAPTKLGRTISLSGISPESGAILAGFLRALINLAEKERESKPVPTNYLKRLSDLDFIFISLVAFENRQNWLSKPSKKAIEQTQQYIESLPPEEKPLVNLWRAEDSATHPTRRLLATLRIEQGSSPAATEAIFYRIMQTAILLHRHAKGTTLEHLAREYNTDEGKLEDSLKFTSIWVLNVISQICDSRKCYKLDFLKMKVLELIDNISLGATLGKLLNINGIGKVTVMKLIDNGIKSIEHLATLHLEDLYRLGLDHKKAKLISRFVQRSSR